MWRFWRSGSLAAVVANDLVDLDDDVLGNIGINGLSIDCRGITECGNEITINERRRNLAK